jgi:hypothetical protein
MPVRIPVLNQNPVFRKEGNRNMERAQTSENPQRGIVGFPRGFSMNTVSSKKLGLRSLDFLLKIILSCYNSPQQDRQTSFISCAIKTTSTPNILQLTLSVKKPRLIMLQTIPMPSRELTIALAVLALLLLLVQKVSTRRKESKALLPLPPSPPGGNFIAGHLPTVLKVTKEHRQHLLFQKWAEEYGDVYFVQLGTIQEYFINSDQAVRAIFDKAATQTSERPRWIVSNDHICNRLNVLLLSASEKAWKNQRKATTMGLTNLNLADAGFPFLHFETLKFLNDIAQNPSKGANPQSLFSSIGRYTYSTFASQIFGLDVPDDNSPVIDYIFETGMAQILGIFLVTI